MTLPSSAERTRVVLQFDATTGLLAAGEPVVVYQERQWAAAPSAELTFRERNADTGEYPCPTQCHRTLSYV